MQYGKNVGLLYYRSCIRCYELYIRSNLDGIVWVKNAPFDLIWPPSAPQAPKRTDKNLFEASFVKLALLIFFSFPPTPFSLLHEKMFDLGSWPLFDLTWQLAWLWMGHGKASIGWGATMWKCLMGSRWMLLGVRARLRGGVVQGQSSRKYPQWRDPWVMEGEQSQPLGSLPRLMVRSNWSIRSSTTRPLMADWRCDFCSAHQS